MNDYEIIEFIRDLPEILELKSNDTFVEVIGKMLMRRFILEMNSKEIQDKVVIFLDDVFDIKSVCNSENNTPDVIDKNQLIVDLFLEKKVRLVIGPSCE